MPERFIGVRGSVGELDGHAWLRHEAGRVRSLRDVHFDVVQGCQLQCVGCANSTLQPKVRRIAVEDFDLCLRNIDVKVIGTFSLFNYGEALLHRELPALLACIPRQSWKTVKVEISTNAQFAHWPSLEAALATRVLTGLTVSCDGDGTPEDYERLRPPSRWEKLVEFLRKMRELRDRVHPSMVLSTRTICTEAKGQARWRALLEPLGWSTEFIKWQIIPESKLNMTGHAPAPPAKLCGFLAQHIGLFVQYDGTVVPCCFHPRAAVLGNLKTQTFNEIMRGPARDAMIAAMLKDRAAMPICGGCESD